AVYRCGPDVAKPYLWPLSAPGGMPLTRAWPMEKAALGGSTDHPHQKSAWFCHGDVIPEGVELKQHIKGVEGVDFWSEGKGQGGKGKIENAEGKVSEKHCWGRISAWCDYSGPIDGKNVGIAILADPKNPHPTCWHVRGYGLMAANPFGREKSGFPAMKGKTDLVKLAK